MAGFLSKLQRADMVIEAAVEDIPLKQKIFAGELALFSRKRQCRCLRCLRLHASQPVT